ncbi:hypothetical protein KQI65_11745 [bacterium]|nr:hypothetical protein [bacterium]
MMTYRYIASMIFAAVLLLTACDFPSDPPLKSPESNDPVVVPTGPDQLLPLEDGNLWIYVVTTRSRPNSSAIGALMRKLTFQNMNYYLLRYGTLLGPAGTTKRAFPMLLAQDSAGLGFYQPGDPDDTLRLNSKPMLSFHLPYPAQPDETWAQYNGAEFATRLTDVNLVVPMLTTGIELLCNRYEVALNNRLVEVLYIVPGVCILRVDIEDEQYHTVGWHLKR